MLLEYDRPSAKLQTENGRKHGEYTPAYQFILGPFPSTGVLVALPCTAAGALPSVSVECRDDNET